MKNILTLFCIVFFNYPSSANFEWNNNCREAYENIIDLKFDKAKTIISYEKTTNPKNSIIHLFEDYIDFFIIQIDDNIEDYNELTKNQNNRLELIKKDKTVSVWKKYALAEIHIHWAANKIKHQEYLSAAIDMNKAYRLLVDNQKDYPNFILNNKCLGLLHSLIGSIPTKYQWIINAIGMEGDVNKGIAELEDLVIDLKNSNEYRVYVNETYFWLSFLKMNLQDQPDDLKKLLLELRNSNNLLIQFTSSRIAHRLHENEIVIDILENRTSSTEHYPFKYLEFLLGEAKLYKLDSSCINHFNNYINGYGGKSYKKAAMLRIAWMYLMLNKQEKFNNTISKINNVGDTFIDADAEAQSYYTEKINPNMELIKARLLFDGGYYQNAIDLLETAKSSSAFNNTNHMIEYNYRLGRLYEKTQKTDLAILYYAKTYEKGKDLTSFYAAKSAFQMGLIYEKENKTKLAKEYFNKCIDLKNHQYEKSLEQKSEAGINRISKISNP